ncbi:MAG TPA: prolyl oligopeptidase family serine peptidase [Candidatus Limnocylindria bacterium]|jgi:predicted peptidase|nr:prolyl oligopeptidase family serine peptidase [Candidatus Limnocylindria bacterium]
MHFPRFRSLAVFLAAGTLAFLAGCSTSTGGYGLAAKTPITLTSPVGAQSPEQFSKTVTKTVGLNYLKYLPKDYSVDATKAWPLVIFLHGAGERGTNLTAVAVHGPPKLVREGRDFPFILISPQCPEGQIWEDDTVLGMIDEVMAHHRVDPKRVYLTGLSMGGFGTWSLASRHPERFAAVAPICGGGERLRILLQTKEQKESMKTLGVWAFHGAKDPVVVLDESQRMVAAFKTAGVKDIQLTVYPEAGHDSWTQAYNEPTFFDWLLSHSR